MTAPKLDNPPPEYMPFPAWSLPTLSATPGWYEAGFRAWGLVIHPDEGLSMVAGTASDAAVSWMFDKAADCCGVRAGFSATPPTACNTHYMRGVGCDLALVRESERHAPNLLAGAVLDAIGNHLETAYYSLPIHGTVCLYLPNQRTDLDLAHPMPPELIADVAAAAEEHARAGKGGTGA